MTNNLNWISIWSRISQASLSELLKQTWETCLSCLSSTLFQRLLSIIQWFDWQYINHFKCLLYNIKTLFLLFINSIDFNIMNVRIDVSRVGLLALVCHYCFCGGHGSAPIFRPGLTIALLLVRVRQLNEALLSEHYSIIWIIWILLPKKRINIKLQFFEQFEQAHSKFITFFLPLL